MANVLNALLETSTKRLREAEDEIDELNAEVDELMDVVERLKAPWHVGMAIGFISGIALSAGIFYTLRVII